MALSMASVKFIGRYSFSLKDDMDKQLCIFVELNRFFPNSNLFLFFKHFLALHFDPLTLWIP
jgi:hypothetical protein